MNDAGDAARDVRRSWIVRGRVQRVGFRWWARNVALDLGVRGWVRNRGDGSVEVHGSGAAAAVEAFERALREGPAPARVDSLESGGTDGTGLPAEGFDIVR